MGKGREKRGGRGKGRGGTGNEGGREGVGMSGKGREGEEKGGRRRGGGEKKSKNTPPSIPAYTPVACVDTACVFLEVLVILIQYRSVYCWVYWPFVI